MESNIVTNFEDQDIDIFEGPLVCLPQTLTLSTNLKYYSTFQSTAAECIFFSNAHGTFTKTDHILGHKMSLNTFEMLKSYKIHSLLKDFCYV